jgi:hypothetical protein
MATDDGGNRKTEARVNRLYWESDSSVNAIGEELGLSKGRLYDLLRPLPTGLGCPRCGSELGFENRTARDRGQLACSRCDFEGSQKDALPAPEEGAELAPPPRDSGWDRGPVVNTTIAAGLLAGAVAGVLLGRFLRR